MNIAFGLFCAGITGVALYMAFRAIVSASKTNTEIMKQHVYERDMWSAERLKLIQQHHAERAELLNRIKPETSQYPIMGTENIVKAVEIDSDESYWDSDAVSTEVKDLMEQAAQNGLYDEGTP